MSDDSGSAQPPKDDRRDEAVAAAVFVGIVLAAVGAVLGLVLAFKRREATCPDGTTFSADETDFRCFVHPHALDGSALAIVCVLLGILIGLVGVVARAAVTARQSGTPR